MPCPITLIEVQAHMNLLSTMANRITELFWSGKINYGLKYTLHSEIWYRFVYWTEVRETLITLGQRRHMYVQ